MKKNASLIILLGLVVLLGGYLGFGARNAENPQQPRQVDASKEGNPVAPRKKEVKEVKTEKTKSQVPDTDPEQGEIFVEGEVKAVDVEKRILTIDQHMDDNSVTITPNVTIAGDAIIQNQEMDISLAEIKTGDIVGMILNKDRKARAVLVNY